MLYKTCLYKKRKNNVLIYSECVSNLRLKSFYMKTRYENTYSYEKIKANLFSYSRE